MPEEKLFGESLCTKKKKYSSTTIRYNYKIHTINNNQYSTLEISVTV